MAFPPETSSEQTAGKWCRDIGPDWDSLYDRILTLSGPAAQRLPVDVLSCITKALNMIEMSIYVEDCLPVITEAAHMYLLTMGTFSKRRMDSNAVDEARNQLIAAIRALEDEVRLCAPLTVGF